MGDLVTSKSPLIKIAQYDGNESFTSSFSELPDTLPQSQTENLPLLPTVATYNLRSLIPKVHNLKTDILERCVDLAFLQEIWEQSDNDHHQSEIEKLFELNGLIYCSNTRPKNMKGTSYGGVALIVNSAHFIIQKVDAFLFHLDVQLCWAFIFV